jgi:hypothetical protein
MGLLKLGVALSIAFTGGCYEPELRDCTITCNAESDCAAGQLCGSDHFCASPEIAGRCSSLPSDAGSGGRDAGVDGPKIVDAAPPPDAPTHAALTVAIDGQGRIVMLGVGTCEKSGPQNGMCVYSVKIGSLVTAQAQAYEDWRFDKWMTPVCMGASISTCTFTVNAATPLAVKFKKD